MRPLDSAGYSFALSIIRSALGRVTVGRCRCWCSIWVRSRNLIRRSTSRSTWQGWRGRCDDRVLGTRTGQPQSPASECDRDLFLCPGRRGDAHARRQRRRRAGFVRLYIRPASCTNTAMVRHARSCSACAMARTSPVVPRIGRAIRIGGRGPRIPHISRSGGEGELAAPIGAALTPRPGPADYSPVGQGNGP